MSNRSIEALGAAIAVLATLAPSWLTAGDLRLPPGDPGAGQQAMVELHCIHCHSVKGADIKHAELGQRINLPLAAEERFVRSNEDLLTAITNPRHVVRKQYSGLFSTAEGAAVEPFMLDLTPTMTVRQLIDIVAFLDESYAANVPGYVSKP